MSGLLTKEMEEKLTKELSEFMIENARKSFNSGASAVVEILREAMKKSGLDYVPKMWIDTAEREVKKWNKK